LIHNYIIHQTESKHSYYHQRVISILPQLSVLISAVSYHFEKKLFTNLRNNIQWTQQRKVLEVKAN